MIIKKKIKNAHSDPRLRAGEEAELEMAFLLERRFSNEPDIHVINDLRIEHKNNIFQIDHLIVTPWGLFVIESKSAHSTIKIKVWDNKRHHWSREFNGTFEGMDSPVRQAEEQARLLKIFLRENHDKMLGKMAGVFQKGFRYCPILEMVAISKNGKIEVENSSLPEKVFKADEIAPEIAIRVVELRKKASLFNISLDSGWEMSAEEAAHVAKFLSESHHPSQKRASDATPVSSTVPRIGAICPSCKSGKLIRKSTPRADGTETDYLACEGYPKNCSQIFALITQPINFSKPPVAEGRCAEIGMEKINFSKRPAMNSGPKKGKRYCFKCNAAISEKVAKYCFDQPSIFGGRAYCISCQQEFKKH